MAEPFKSFVNRDSIARLGDAIAAVHPAFDRRAFVKRAASGLDPLELKARIAHVAAALGEHLPQPFPAAAKTLCAAARTATLPLTGWQAWPAVTYVELHGLDHPQDALDTLACLTPFASAEFAVRPYVERHPKLTWQRLHEWARSDDQHLRRLASEGTRPRLPWGRQLPELRRDPSPSLALLDVLRDDPEEYVRRSVANHLNDVAKDHPDLAIAAASRWLTSPSPGAQWMVRHALRSLIKAGHPDALTLLGASPTARIDVTDLRIDTPAVKLGDSLRFSFTLTSRSPRTATPVHAIVDYVIHHRRANGTLSPKVFKLTTRDLPSHTPVTISRAHPIRPITTRRYYPGEHLLQIQVNGRVLASAPFTLWV